MEQLALVLMLFMFAGSVSADLTGQSCSPETEVVDLSTLRSVITDPEVVALRDAFVRARAPAMSDLKPGRIWNCVHRNAFTNDRYTEHGVKMRFSRRRDGVRNDQNFVIKDLKLKQDGLVGQVSISEYGGTKLYGILRVTPDGKLVGEVSLADHPGEIRRLARHYHHEPFVTIPAVAGPEKRVFYYTTCELSATP